MDSGFVGRGNVDEVNPRILITGGTGKLGAACAREAARRGWTLEAPPRSEMDVTDSASVRSVVGTAEPDVVVHAAAYTAVDRAEEEVEAAYRVNRDGTRHVAEAAAEAGARLLYVSTDYVFDGRAERPYRPDDPAAPLNVYGASKRAGEEAALETGEDVLVVRTSWLYGPDGSDFVDTVLRLAGEGGPLRVVTDQIGRPTWSGSAATALLDLAETDVRGILHLSDAGEEASWYDFAVEIVRLAGIDVPVEPVSTDPSARPARRPACSVLDLTETERVLGRDLPPWRDSLARHMERIGAGNPGPGA